MLSQRRSFVLGMFLTATAGLTGCKSGETVTDAAEDPLLVRYEDQELHFSDVQENTPFAIQSPDSAQIIAQYADRWIRERMMAKEAREKLGSSAEIDALTEKFREELQVMHYEEKLVREKLDTVISDEELMAYYKNNKSKYKLESTIFRFVFIKAAKPVEDSKTLEDLWKNLSSRNLQELNLYCQNNAEVCFLHPEKWYKWDEVGPYLPSKFVQESTVQSGISRDFADFNHAYKIRFFEVVKPNQDPPLSFVREQATQAILHQRKLKILDQYKAELYERELKNKKIQFINK